MEKKEQYKEIETKKLSELENADTYLTKIACIKDEGSVEWENTELEDTESEKISLWALFGKKKGGDEAVCLQVGASIDSQNEIKQDINKMFDETSSVFDTNKMRAIDTQFYKNAYYIPSYEKNVNKSIYQYRKIKKDYKELLFYKIDIDKYLGVDDAKIIDIHVREIYNFSKAYYAETKFAFETQSIYWNAYRSGVGIETLKKLLRQTSK